MKTIRVVAAIIVCEGKVFATQRGYGEFKDWWEFPGGKIEEGESAELALKREILEELDMQVHVGEFVDTIEWDYPSFHLSMDCFLCTLAGDMPHLLEHEAARWLSPGQLYSVQWLPADRLLLPKIEKILELR